MIVRAFNGSKKEIAGMIELELEIAGQDFLVPFQVMDIHPGYNMLLGRLWLHTTGAVASSLHQCVKFPLGNKIITIRGEDALLICRADPIPYVTEEEGVLESTVQGFEVVNATFIGQETRRFPLQIPVEVKMLRSMLKQGFHPGQGLGPMGQGIREIVHISPTKGTFGLGFKPSAKDREEQRRRRMARRWGRHETITLFPVPHIRVTFPRPTYIEYDNGGKEENLTEAVQNMTICTVGADLSSNTTSPGPIYHSNESIANWKEEANPTVTKRIKY